ncbi:MAG: lysophospholipase [Saprospiraceae bacterium]
MIKTSNGWNLFTKNYILGKAKASVLIIHGLAEHCERYAHVAKALNEIGCNVYTFDLRGHGQSTGTAALALSTDEYREDVENVYHTIPKNLPIYILGHSMGGMIALKFLVFRERKDIKGAIFSGAALEVGEDITPITKKMVKILGKIAPSFKTVKLNPESISRDPETVEAYKNDPLIYHGGAKAGLGLALLDTIKELKDQFHLLDKPVLIMHGGDDKITNIKGSEALYNTCKSEDKTLKIWEGAYHEIFNETNKNDVISFMTTWVSHRI